MARISVTQHVSVNSAVTYIGCVGCESRHEYQSLVPKWLKHNSNIYPFKMCFVLKMNFQKIVFWIFESTLYLKLQNQCILPNSVKENLFLFIYQIKFLVWSINNLSYETRNKYDSYSKVNKSIMNLIAFLWQLEDYKNNKTLG